MFQFVLAQCSQMAEITKCPPGVARNARLHYWQFGVNDEFGPANIGTARRLATGDLTPCEGAIVDIVLNRSGDVPQRELEAELAKRLGKSPAFVYRAAQRLAKHGTICRKKISRQWHYARPGFHWLRPRQNHEPLPD
jgi:hypothetical protein